MKAQDFNIYNTFTKILGEQPILFFSIPPYQRNYAWGKEQLEDFWKTIWILKENYPKTLEKQKEYLKTYYFFGSLLLQKNIKNPQHLEIVDGQQRSITFFLFTVNLLIAYPKINSPELQTVKDLFFDQEGKARISVKNKDQEYFNQLAQYNISTIEGKASIQEVIKLWEKEKNQDKDQKITGKIRENTLFFYDKIKYLTSEEIEVMSYIFMSKIRYIQIILESYEDAYSIFDTMNSKGLGLTFPDIVKNLIGRVNPKLFVKWEKTFEMLEEDKDFWENHLVRMFEQYLNSFILGIELTQREKERIYRDKIENYHLEEANQELVNIIEFSSEYLRIHHNNTTQMRTDIELNICFN